MGEEGLNKEPESWELRIELQEYSFLPAAWGSCMEPMVGVPSIFSFLDEGPLATDSGLTQGRAGCPRVVCVGSYTQEPPLTMTEGGQRINIPASMTFG